jgi:hypothetical protein
MTILPSKNHISTQTQSETTACVIEYVKLVENQLGTTVKLAKSDLGGGFVAGKLDTFFKPKAIEHHQVPPTAHAQNGRVERAHLTIANDMRTLLVDSKLGPEFWADAATYAVYTRNRIPGKDQKESPEAIWYGRPPKMDHLQPFGDANNPGGTDFLDQGVLAELEAKGVKICFCGHDVDDYAWSSPATLRIQVIQIPLVSSFPLTQFRFEFPF